MSSVMNLKSTSDGRWGKKPRSKRREHAGRKKSTKKHDSAGGQSPHGPDGLATRCLPGNNVIKKATEPKLPCGMQALECLQTRRRATSCTSVAPFNLFILVLSQRRTCHSGPPKLQVVQLAVEEPGKTPQDSVALSAEALLNCRGHCNKSYGSVLSHAEQDEWRV